MVSNKVVTSRGPGTSLEFSLKLVEVLYDRETAEKIQQAMLVPSFWLDQLGADDTRQLISRM